MMSEVDYRIKDAVDRYIYRHANHPKSISMSWQFEPELAKQASLTPMFNNLGQTFWQWHGMTVKFVRRKNYVECFPRKKRSKPSLFGSPMYASIMYGSPNLATPKFSGMLSIV